jgi:hypothetical protein
MHGLQIHARITNPRTDYKSAQARGNSASKKDLALYVNYKKIYNFAAKIKRYEQK